jgi:hypothetical protein
MQTSGQCLQGYYRWREDLASCSFFPRWLSLLPKLNSFADRSTNSPSQRLQLGQRGNIERYGEFGDALSQKQETEEEATNVAIGANIVVKGIIGMVTVDEDDCLSFKGEPKFAETGQAATEKFITRT